MDEVAGAVLLMPLCHTHQRWPVSTRLSATDATLERGGAVATEVSEELATRLFQMTEHRGCYVALGRDTADMAGLLQPSVDVQRITDAASWSVTRSHRFRRLAHINLQELQETLVEVIDRSSLWVELHG